MADPTYGIAAERYFGHAPSAREPRMSFDRLPHEEDLPNDRRAAAYEAHLTTLERELPGLERELARIRQEGTAKAPAGCDLSC
jgi:hypothetical protein